MDRGNGLGERAVAEVDPALLRRPRLQGSLPRRHQTSLRHGRPLQRHGAGDGRSWVSHAYRKTSNKPPLGAYSFNPSEVGEFLNYLT